MTANPLKRFFVLLGILLIIVLVAIFYWRWKDQWHSFFEAGPQRDKGYTMSYDRLFSESDVPFTDRMDREQTKVIEKAKESVLAIKSIGRVIVKTYYADGRNVRTEVRTQHNYGSGAIVTYEGHVVTNNHVIDGYSEFQMTFSDQHKCFARKVGTNHWQDIAVLKLYTSKKTTPLPFGDSKKIRMGQMIFSLGNSYGMGISATTGVVSAVTKQFDLGTSKIQIDGSIHPGDSGGPLLNIYGEIIGVNASRFAGNKEFKLDVDSPNIGFAIPSNAAVEAFGKIFKNSEWILNDLGITLVNVDSPAINEYLDYLNPPENHQVIIRHVAPDTPAEKAGLKQGDVLLQLNGQDVFTNDDVMAELRKLIAQDPIRLLVKCNNRNHSNEEKREYSFKFEPDVYKGGKIAEIIYKIDILGAEFSWISLEDEIKNQKFGLRVNTIQALSPLAGRVRKGDIIYKLNDVELTDEESIFQFHRTDLNNLFIDYYRDGEAGSIDIFMTK